MSNMTLREALSHATDCLEHRAEQWREAATGDTLGNTIDCFIEAGSEECNAIAQDQETALEELLMFIDNSKSLIDDYWQMNGPIEIEGVEEYQKEFPLMQKIKNITDHQMAKLLRENGAIDNFTHDGNTCKWFNKNGRLIAIAFYDNVKIIRQVFLPDYVNYKDDSNNETK